MGEIVITENSSIDTPSSGNRTLAPKADGWYQKDSAGNETKLAGDIDAIHDNASSEISAITEKTSVVGNDIVLIEDSVDSYNKKKVKFKNIHVFGQSFQESSEDTADTNASVTPEEYLTMTENGCEAGKFRVGMTVCWNMSTAGRNIVINVKVDGTIIGTLEMESKDSGTDIRNWNTGFMYPVLTAGNHAISLEYAPENSSDTARMYYAGLEFWRVS